MKLYLVRHGESEGNKGRMHQTDATVLSSSGLLQAQKVAKRFAHTPVDLIIASTTTRTRQTANEIHKLLKCPIEFDEKLKEQKGPAEVLGKSWEDAKVLEVWEKINKNHHNPNYHTSDEENNWDFIHRISTALESIAQKPQESIMIVTHGYVIRAITGLVLLGPEFTSRQFQYMKKASFAKNTGVTVCEYTTEHGWVLDTYNDHAHLLE